MTDDAFDAFALHNRISLRAVVTHGDEDPTETLAAAGIHDPVSFPITFGANAQPVSDIPGIDAVLEIAAPKPAATTAPPVAPPAAPAAAAAGPASGSLAPRQPTPRWQNAAVAFNPVTAGLRAPGDAQQPVDYVPLRDRIAQAKFSIPSYTPRRLGWPAASDAAAERPGLGQQQAAAAPPKDDDSAPPGREVSPETPLQAMPPGPIPDQSGPVEPDDQPPPNPLFGPGQGGSPNPGRPTGKAPRAATPSFQIGAGDDGPGEWRVAPVRSMRPEDRAFQMSATGAPEGIEYRVPTSRMPSGEKWFDGYDPGTNRLVDAKNYTDWPKENLKFSMDEVRKELTDEARVAGQKGVKLLLRVATQEKADLLQKIVDDAELKNVDVEKWPKRQEHAT